MYSLKPAEFIKYYQHVVFNSLVVEHRCRTTTGTRQPILATTLKPFLLPTVIGCQYGLSSGWKYIILSSTRARMSWQQECLDLVQVLYQSHSHCECVSTMPVHVCLRNTMPYSISISSSKSPVLDGKIRYRCPIQSWALHTILPRRAERSTTALPWILNSCDSLH